MAELPRFAGQPAPPARAPLDASFDRDMLFGLRSAVAAHAADLGAGVLTDDVVIMAHELATNAVRHGGGRGRLWLWREGTVLCCRVTDAGQGLSDPGGAGRHRPSPAVAGGRGLWIVRQIADRVDISAGPDGTTVTAVISVAQPDEGL